MIKIQDSEHFFRLQKRFKKIPFTQSRGWYDYLIAQGKQIVFFINDENEPTLLFYAVVRSIPFVGLQILFIDGEVYREGLSEKVFKKAYLGLIEFNYAAIEINSNNPYLVDFEVGIRRAGFVRPLALFSCPLTINVHLKNKINTTTDWKRNVKKSIEQNLQFSEVVQLTNEIVDKVVNIFTEMSELKGLGYMLEKNSLVHLLESEDMRLFIVTDCNDQMLSARIVHDNKPFSTDIFAANALKSRDCGSAYFIMQCVFEHLASQGFEYFDFGRIPPSNHATDNVYQFKSASRGDEIQYNGEWVYYDKMGLEFLMLFYKFFKLKKQRY